MTLTLLQLRPAQITTHPRNPRTEVGDVSALAESIRSAGILEPLIVAPATGKTGDIVPEKFRLIAGHRRLAAARQLKVKTVPAIVREDLAGDDTAQIAAMLVENLQRVDLTPIEEGAGYQALLEFPGWTAAKVAAATGRSRATVRGRIALAALPKGTRDRIHTGQITLDQAAELARRAGAPDALRELEKAAGTDGWFYTLQRVKDDEAKARALAKALAAAAEAHPGVRLLSGNDLPHGWRYRLTGVVPLDRFDPDLDPETHAQACPGHALALEPHAGWRSGRAVYLVDQVAVCTTPEAHAEASDPVAAAAAAAEAERAATHTALLEQLATAATVRREHLAVCIARGTGAHQVALTTARAAVGKAYGAKRRRYAADLLGTTEEDLEEFLQQLDLPALVVFADIVAAYPTDHDLATSLHAWGPKSWASGYRDRLTDVYGWTWTPGEAAALDFTAEQLAAAQASEPDLDDEGDDDEGDDE